LSNTERRGPKVQLCGVEGEASEIVKFTTSRELVKQNAQQGKQSMNGSEQGGRPSRVTVSPVAPVTPRANHLLKPRLQLQQNLKQKSCVDKLGKSIYEVLVSVALFAFYAMRSII